MLIDVVIPTYNRSKIIVNGLNSLIKQNLQTWKAFIVDDGSTDDTQEVVESFNDSRLKYIYQQNAERSSARNNGIEHANGEWICFLDSDDEYTPEHLSSIAEFIEKENPAPGLISTGLLISNGKELKKKDFLSLQNNILVEIGEKFLIPTQVCVHRSILEKEKFDTRFRLWEDTHLWLRIAAQYPVYQIEKYTAIQNIHDEGTVVQGMKKIRYAEMQQYIAAISDVQKNYRDLFNNNLPENYFLDYITIKYNMYLYQARQNKQFYVALKIWWEGFLHKPSLYLISEFPKIWLNKLNIGIHDR